MDRRVRTLLVVRPQAVEEGTEIMTREETLARWLENEKTLYEVWRVRALRFAERLEHRIGDIGEYHYPGCGFHYVVQWQIRKTLVALAEQLPNNYREAVVMAIVRKVSLGVLATEVAEAEKYIAENREALSKLVRVVTD